MRTNREVLESHLALRAEGKHEEDIERNYSTDVVVIDRYREYVGHRGVRESAKILEDSLSGAEFVYERKAINGRIAYLLWSVNIDGQTVQGIDSFLIEDDRIRGQTIYYHL